MATPFVKALILINVVAFVAGLLRVLPLIHWLALWPYGLFTPAAFPDGAPVFWPWQVVTYAFLHGSLLHLFLNMYALWLFGVRLERHWGQRKFGLFYFSCVVGAALTQLLVSEITLLHGGEVYPVIGASGGVFGLLLAFAVLFPEAELLLLFPPVPIKAKWLVVGYGAIELLAGVTGTAEGVAHFAHLGGMLTGWVLLHDWRGGRAPGSGREHARVRPADPQLDSVRHHRVPAVRPCQSPEGNPATPQITLRDSLGIQSAPGQSAAAARSPSWADSRLSGGELPVSTHSAADATGPLSALHTLGRQGWLT